LGKTLLCMDETNSIEQWKLLASIVENLSEAYFAELTNQGHLWSHYDWMNQTFKMHVCQFAFGCRASFVASIRDPDMLESAFEFGKNYGYFFRAKQEIGHFDQNGEAEAFPNETMLVNS